MGDPVCVHVHPDGRGPCFSIARSDRSDCCPHGVEIIDTAGNTVAIVRRVPAAYPSGAQTTIEIVNGLALPYVP